MKENQGNKEKSKNTLVLSRKNKIFLLAIVVIIVVVIVGVVIWQKNKDRKDTPVVEGPENLDTYVLSMDAAPGESEIKDVNAKLLEKKSTDGIEIEEIKYISGGGQTRVKLKLKNTTEEEIREKYVKLTYIDTKGKEMETLDMFVASIPAEETTIVYNNTAVEITKAVEYKMQVVSMKEETVLPEDYVPPVPEEE